MSLFHAYVLVAFLFIAATKGQGLLLAMVAKQWRLLDQSRTSSLYCDQGTTKALLHIEPGPQLDIPCIPMRLDHAANHQQRKADLPLAFCLLEDRLTGPEHAKFLDLLDTLGYKSASLCD